jgi:hypothetical protein
MTERYINHPQDITDLINELKDKSLPLQIMVMKAVPEKHHEEEHEKRRKQMAYFHRTICTAYADAAGVDEQRAKYELLVKFGCVEEIIEDESGEWDTVWLDNDKLRVFTEGKGYRIMSVGALANDQLARLIDQSKNYLLQYYGIMVTEFERKYKTK